MTITQKSRTILAVIAAIAFTIYCLVSLFKGELWRALIWGALSLYMIRTAKSTYKEEWVVEKHGQNFTIRRNTQIVFQGPSSNISHIDSAFGNFWIHTHQEQRIEVPKELKSEKRFQLILTDHQVNHEIGR